MALVWGRVADPRLDLRVDIGPETAAGWAGVRMAAADSPSCGPSTRLARTKVDTHFYTISERILF